MNRHTRSLILDDTIWDDLHSSFLQEQLASGDRVTKTDFVERVFRLGLEATARARISRHGMSDASAPRTEATRPPSRPARPPAMEAVAATRRPEPQPAVSTDTATATQPPPTATPAEASEPVAERSRSAQATRAPRRSLDRLLNMSQVGDPSQISSAADRRADRG